ncbi:hypothetical protein [Yoonia sp. 2307UL14-13]|uniref:hypothetical protein n=1 Tax=Yoonia sp. 2307UL14-13 TaxID=3126506 RepID=UPI0030B4605D
MTSEGSGKLIISLVFIAGIALVDGAGAIAFCKSETYASLKGTVTAQLDAISNVSLPTMNSGGSILLGPAFASAEKQAQEQLAEREAARNLTLIAPSRAHPAPPTEPVTTDRMGAVIGMGHAVTDGDAPVALNEVFTNFQPTGPNHPHGAITPFDTNENCTLRAIRPNEKLANVNVMRPNMLAPIQLVYQDSIHEVIERQTKEALEEGHSIGMMSIPRWTLGVIDVVVTDSSGPLYLALQSYGGVMWKIHATGGVDIAHIAMISNRTSALTGNIGNASFEAVRTADFDTPPDFYHYDSELGDLECMTTPYRKPDESWGAWNGAKRGNSLDGNLLFGQDKGFDAYDHWFTETLGISATTNLIEAAQAGAVLVGDVPNYAIGNVTRIKGGDFVSAFLPDTDENRTHEIPQERTAFLAEILDLCAALRAEYGNCLIGTAGFYLDRAARFSGGGVSAHAAAWVEVYLPDNPFEQRNFQEKVNAILAEKGN